MAVVHGLTDFITCKMGGCCGEAIADARHVGEDLGLFAGVKAWHFDMGGGYEASYGDATLSDDDFLTCGGAVDQFVAAGFEFGGGDIHGHTPIRQSID
jgi:hypothetical protein